MEVIKEAWRKAVLEGIQQQQATEEKAKESVRDLIGSPTRSSHSMGDFYLPKKSNSRPQLDISDPSIANTVRRTSSAPIIRINSLSESELFENLQPLFSNPALEVLMQCMFGLPFVDERNLRLTLR